MAPDKRDELYNNLINSGRVSENEIGTIDDFKAAITDEATAKEFHQNLLNSGIFTISDIGDAADFWLSIRDDFSQPTAATQPTAQQPTQRNMGTPGYVPNRFGIPTQQQGGTGPVADAAPNPQVPAQPLSFQERVQKSVGMAHNVGKAKADFSQRMSAIEQGNKPFSNGKSQQYDPTTGETKDVYYTTTGQAVSTPMERDVENIKHSPEQIAKEGRIKVMDQIPDMTGEVSEALNQRGLELDEEALHNPQGDRPMGGGAMVHTFNSSTSNGRLSDERWRMLYAAKVALDRANNMMREANTKGGVHDLGASEFVRGMGKVGNPDTWDMGLTEGVESTAMMVALQKADNGEDLTREEQMLLDAKAVEMATAMFYASDLSGWYKAGEVTADALPFMLEMMINPAAKVGRSAQSMLTRYALKRFGKQALKRGGEKFIKGALRRFGGRAGIDLLGASYLTTTSSLPRVGADAISRMNGDVQFKNNEEGGIEYAGHTKGEDWWSAWSKGYLSTLTDNYSEMLGEYFAPLFKWLGKGIGRGATSLADTKFGKWLHLGGGIDKVEDFIKGVSARDAYKFISDLEENAQWHGILGEYAEEVAGNLINAILHIDMTLDADPDTGVFNLKKNLETLQGVAVMGGFFSAMKTVGYRNPAHVARRAMKKADRAGASAFGEQWESIRSMIDGGQSDAFDDTWDGMNDSQKQAILEYTKAAYTYKGIAEGKAKRDAEGVQTQQEAAAEQSYNTGYEDANTDELRSDINMAYTEARQRLVELIGEDNVSVIDEDPLGMQQLYDTDPNVSDEVTMAVAEYVSAKSAWDGVQQRISDDAADRADQRRAEGKRMAYKGKGDMQGAIRPLIINEDSSERDPETGERIKKTVYLVNGTIAIEPNGNGLSREGTDKTIYVYDPETGDTHELDPFGGAGVLSVGDVVSMEDYLADNEQQSQAEVQQAAETAQGKVKKNTPFETPQGRKGVVQSIEGDNAIVLFADGEMEQASMPLAEVQQYADALRRKEYEARHPQQATAEQPQQPNTATETFNVGDDVAIPVVGEDGYDHYQQYRITDIEGEDVTVQDKDGNKFIVNINNVNKINKPQQPNAGEVGQAPTAQAETPTEGGNETRAKQIAETIKNVFGGNIDRYITHLSNTISANRKRDRGDVSENSYNLTFVRNNRGLVEQYLTEGGNATEDTRTPAQRTYDDVVAKLGADRASKKIDATAKVKADRLTKAQKALKTAQETADNTEYGSKEEQKAEEAVVKAQAEYDAAQQDMAAWDEVRKLRDQALLAQSEAEDAARKAELERKRAAETEAQRKQREEYEADQARRKAEAEAAEKRRQEENERLRQQAANPQPAEEPAPIEGTKGQASQLEIARQELEGDPEALAMLDETTPRTLVEVAATLLASGKNATKLLKEDFKRETGYSDADVKRYPFLFAGADKGGITLARFSEKVVETARNYGVQFDESDATAGMDALLELLGSVSNQADINNYITNSRIAEAYDYHNAALAAARARMLEAYGMTEGEYEAYMSWLEDAAEQRKNTLTDEQALELINQAIQQDNERQAETNAGNSEQQSTETTERPESAETDVSQNGERGNGETDAGEQPQQPAVGSESAQQPKEEAEGGTETAPQPVGGVPAQGETPAAGQTEGTAEGETEQYISGYKPSKKVAEFEKESNRLAKQLSELEEQRDRLSEQREAKRKEIKGLRGKKREEANAEITSLGESIARLNEEIDRAEDESNSANYVYYDARDAELYAHLGKLSKEKLEALAKQLEERFGKGTDALFDNDEYSAIINVLDEKSFEEQAEAPKQETKPLTNNEKNWREVVEVGVAQYSHVIADNVERSGFEFADEIRKAYDTSNPQAKAIVQAIEQHISSIKVRPDGSTQYKVSEETLEREEQPKQETKAETWEEHVNKAMEAYDKEYAAIEKSDGERLRKEAAGYSDERLLNTYIRNAGISQIFGKGREGMRKFIGEEKNFKAEKLDEVKENNLEAAPDAARQSFVQDVLRAELDRRGIEYKEEYTFAETSEANDWYKKNVEGKAEQPRAAVGERENKEPEKGGKVEKVKNEAAAPKQKIDDVGEKIGGARKDLAQKMGAKINLDADTFPKMFPKFDLKKAVEQGLDPKLASSVYFLRIAAQKEYKSWLKHSTKGKALSAAKFFAAYAKQFLENGNTSTEFKDNRWTFTEYGKKHIEYNLALYEKVYEKFGNTLFDLDLTGYEIIPIEQRSGYTYYRRNEKGEDEKYQPAYEARSVYSSKYYVEGELDKAIDELVNRMAESVSYKESHPYKLSHYYMPGVANSHYIGVKLGGKVVALTEKMGDRETSKYLKEHEAELQEKAKRLDEERKQSKQGGTNTKWKPELGLGGGRARVGNDYRNGKDVSAEELRETFGFRGVEFGNYVTQAERQRFINEAYDAMMDLAALLNVSPRALSLGGRLGFAIGARGGGSAMAHYEPDLNVINLTKSKGAGSLAHEWWHALDYYFNSMGDYRKTPATANKRAEDFNPGHRAEMANAFVSLMEKINSSDYRKRSVALDAALNKDYYTNPTELGARAFQDYVQRRLTDKGQVNDFLSSFTPEEQWNGKAETYPYPTGKDADAIDERFDNLFGTMLEREDEQGNVMLYERADGKAARVSAKERKLRDAVVDLLRKAGIDVIMDEEAWQRVQNEEGKKPMLTKDGEAYGFTLNGKIYLDPRIATAETPIHEYTHLWAAALRAANPKAWERLKSELEKDTELMAYVQRLYPELKGDELMDEVFAHFSGRRGAERMRAEQERMEGETHSLVGKAKVIAMFENLRDALKKFWNMARDLFAGKTRGVEKLSAEDFADMALADLLNGVKPDRGDRVDRSDRERDAEYMEDVESGDMEKAQRMVNEAAKRAMPDTKVVDENGNPLVVYHGTFDRNAEGRFYEFKTPSYFSNDEETAQIFSRDLTNEYLGKLGEKYKVERPEGAKGYVMPVFLDVKKPKIIDFGGKAWGASNYEKTQEFEKAVSALNETDEYDAVIAVNIVEGGNAKNGNITTTYAVKSPYQIKSADPVTYDDNGNVIPLSQRFNERNADIRYQRGATDSDVRFRGEEEPPLQTTDENGTHDVVKLTDIDAFTAGTYDKAAVKKLADWLKENKDTYVRLYHGTSSDNTIETEGIRRTNNRNKHSYQSQNGYVYLSIYPSSSRLFGELGSGRNGEDVSVYAVDVKVKDLLPDTDQLNNKRAWGGEEFADMGNSLAESILYGSGARVKRDILPSETSKTLFRGEEEPVFYSNAMRAVENIKQERATPEQWVKMIEKQGGMKAGEDKWLGLSEWLKGSDAKTLTKGEVLDYIRANEIQVEEVSYSEDGRHWDYDRIFEDRNPRVYLKGYNAYTEELPNNEYNAYVNGELIGTFYDALSAKEAITERLNLTPINETRLSYTTRGLDNKREIVLTVPTIEPWNEYDEVHFGEAGGGRAVAWVRFGETTDADGKRVLVIDEIQSNRHQEGREKGYLNKGVIEEYNHRGDILTKWRKHFIDKYDIEPWRSDEDIIKRLDEYEKEDFIYIKRKYEEAREKYRALGSVPDAPFDKNWHEVAMKRMLRFAAENGYDKVAWTKGEQQAERYDLSTQVKRIRIARHFDELTAEPIEGEYEVYLDDRYDVPIVESNGMTGVLSEERIKEVYGKDLGQRMIDAAKEKDDQFASFEGNDLRIGGEGMKGFYDQILPRFMDKYGKKWGVKTGEVELPNIGDNGLTMWSVDVTDDMRESVMRGQPLFRPKTQSREGGEEAYAGEWYDRNSVERIGEFAGYTPKQIAAMNARQEQSARNKFRDAAEKLHLGDTITFADSIDDVPGLTDKQRKEWRRKKGWYSPRTGKIVIILGNHKSMDDVMKSILHEGVAHHGLRELFGEHFNTFLDNVYRVASPEIRERIYAMAKKHGWDFRTATEEYLAQLAEDTDFERPESQSWWKQVKAWFIDMLHKIGFRLHDVYDTITDNELRYILWRSYENLVNPGRYNSVVEEAKDIAKQYDLRVGQWDETWTVAAEAEPNATMEFNGRRVPIWATNGRRGNRADRVERNDRIGSDYNVAADGVAEDGVRFRDGEDEETGAPKPQARGLYERAMNDGWNQFTEAMQDSMMSVKKLVMSVLEARGEKGKKMRIEDVAGYENPWLAENRLRGSIKNQVFAWQRDYMEPLRKAIYDITGGIKPAYDELMDYMMAKHGLERNEVLAKRDAKKAWEEQNKSEIGNPNYTAAKNAAFANIDAGVDDLYLEQRKKDYAGLTALTGKEDVEEAEKEAQRMVDEFEKRFDTTKLWEATNKATRSSLFTMLECGMMTPARHAEIRDMFQYYIPLQGFDSDVAEDVYAYMGSDGTRLYGTTIRAAKGRKSKADDPIATIAMNGEAAIRRGNRNLMKQHFLRFVQSHPSDLVSINDVWLRKNANGEWEQYFDADLKETDTPEEVADKVRDFNERMEQEAASNPDIYKRSRDLPNVPFRVLNTRDMKQHQVMVQVNGNNYLLTVNGNPRAAQALNGLSNPDVFTESVFGKAMNIAQSVTRELSQFYTTRKPSFVLSNFSRDSIYTNLIVGVKEDKEYSRAFHKNWVNMNPATMGKLFSEWVNGELRDKILAGTATDTERMFNDFLMYGGETGWISMRDIERQKKDLQKALKQEGNTAAQKWKSFWATVDLANRAVENCARFAAFMTSQQMGRSIERSVWDAKEISVNFEKKGAGDKFLGSKNQTVGGWIGAVISGWCRGNYAFWNAGVQGISNFYRAAKKKPGKFALRIFAMNFTLGMMAPLISALLGGDDDDENNYFNLPEYKRRNNLCFRFTKHMPWITIPLPIEFRAIYGLGELAMCHMLGKEHFYNGWDCAKAYMQQLSQVLPLDFLEGGGGWHVLLPTYAKPAVEAYANESWTGLPIYKENKYGQYDELPEWQRAYPNTNMLLVNGTRWINEATVSGDLYTGGNDEDVKGFINWNPARIEYMLRGYLGGYYSMYEHSAKTISTIAGKREFEWRNIPLAHVLITEGDERTAERSIKNEYYKIVDDYEKTDHKVSQYDEKAHTEKENEERRQKLNTDKRYLRHEIVDIYKTLIDKLNDTKKNADEEEKKAIEEYQAGLRKEMVDMVHNLESKSKSELEKGDNLGQIDELAEQALGSRYESGDLSVRKAIGSMTAKRIGERYGSEARDGYGSGSALDTEYGKIYEKHRTYTDMAGDIMLNEEIKRATAEKDYVRLDALEGAKKDIADNRDDLNQYMTQEAIDNIMEVIRKIRRKALYPEQAANPTDNVEE